MVHYVIAQGGIADDPHASPKGLRHGFGEQVIGSGVSLNMFGAHRSACALIILTDACPAF